MSERALAGELQRGPDNGAPGVAVAGPAAAQAV